MTGCQSRQADIKAYVDGELPPARRAAIWWHLLRCAECRKARMAMTEISHRLKVDEADGLDPALRARILSSVAYAEGLREPTRRRMGRAQKRPLVLAGGAAAAALLLFLVTFPAFYQARDKSRSFAKTAAPAYAPAASQSAGRPADEPAGFASPPKSSQLAPETQASGRMQDAPQMKSQLASPSAAAQSQNFRATSSVQSTLRQTQQGGRADIQMGQSAVHRAQVWNGGAPGPSVAEDEAKSRGKSAPALPAAAARPGAVAAGASRPQLRGEAVRKPARPPVAKRAVRSRARASSAASAPAKASK